MMQEYLLAMKEFICIISPHLQSAEKIKLRNKWDTFGNPQKKFMGMMNKMEIL